MLIDSAPSIQSIRFVSRHLTRFVPPRRVPAGVLGGLGAGVAVLLAGVPPPLWDDLVEHLRTRDDINDWTYADAAVLNTLRSLSEDAPAPADPNDIAPMARASEKAEYWKSGLLAGKTSYPDDWRPIVKARACGVGADGTLAPGAAVLVWLDPDAIRDRWTPEMIQRTVRVRVQRTEGWNRLVDRIPDIVTAPTTAPTRFTHFQRSHIRVGLT